MFWRYEITDIIMDIIIWKQQEKKTNEKKIKILSE